MVWSLDRLTGPHSPCEGSIILGIIFEQLLSVAMMSMMELITSIRFFIMLIETAFYLGLKSMGVAGN